MKKIAGIIAGFLAIFSFIESKAQVANCDEAHLANKDSYEIIMNIPMKIKPEYVSTFKKAFDKCQAETLKEEACLAYDLFQSYKDSTEFHLFERWANKPGHLAHMETEHIKVYFQEITGARDRTTAQMITTIVCPVLNKQ